MQYLKTFIFYFISGFSLFAQEYTFEGKVSSFETGIPVPYAIIEAEDGRTFLTDIEGNYSISYHLPFLNATIRNFYFITREYRLSIFDQEEIQLMPLKEIPVFHSTNEQTAHLMREVLKKKPENNPESYGNFSYNTYNKLTITANNIGRLKSALDEFLLMLFGINVWKFPNNNHHVFFLESVTRRRFMNRFHHKELIAGSRASGIDNPSTLTISSFLQSLNIYGNRINIATKNYLSPLNNSALNTYYYSIVDTIHMPRESLYVVCFNPSENREDMVHGIFMISSNNLAVKNTTIITTFDSPSFHFYQTYNQLPDGRWFTSQAKTELLEENFLNFGEDLYIHFITNYSNIEVDRMFSETEFDDVIIEYQEEQQDLGHQFWDSYRKIPLTEKEENTFKFYDTIGGIKNFERLVQIGESYFDGHVPFNIFNIEPNRIFTFNQYEGIRLGMGLHTNARLSRTYSLGGYFAYGFNDRAFKYGGHLSAHLLPDNLLTATIGYMDDLVEAAGIFFPFDRRQYTSENIRQFGLRVFDRIRQPSLTLQSHPVKYLDISLSIADQHITPLYDYHFRDQPANLFKYTELLVGFNYSYGEQFLKSFFYRHSLGSNYPYFWFSFARGFNRNNPEDLSYNRYLARIDHSVNFLKYGTTRFRIIGGYVSGLAPYPKLFNMIGSLREPSVIIHNSFETMDFNEFLSDRFTAVFLSHSFPRVVLSRRFNIKPVPQIIQNFGIGDLRNPEDHDFPFRTIEQGYLETGFIINDIYILNLLGLRVGLGVGTFLRYGPYALPNINENFVFKYALDVRI